MDEKAKKVLAVAGVLLISGLAFMGGARLATGQAGTDQASLLARGEYLVNSAGLCAWCHTPEREPYQPDAARGLVGGRRFDDCWGSTFSTNLTADLVDGLGDWTNQQVIQAIRDGVRPDGSELAPPHPWQLYMGMADDDLGAIVAYLRTLSPASGDWPTPDLVPSPPGFVAPPPVPPGPPRAPRGGVERGQYLAMNVSTCVWCHTPRTDTCVPDITRTLAGGVELHGPWGNVVAPNISNDPVSGLGAWDDADITRAIVEGLTPDGRQLVDAMPWRTYARLTSNDVAAIVAYLRHAAPMPGLGLDSGGEP